MPCAARTVLWFGLAGLACNPPSANVQDLLRVGRVEVEPADLTLRIGRSNQFTATPKTESGIVVTNRAVVWSSSDAGLASVNESGLVTARRVGGPVHIVATVDEVPGSAIVVVIPEPVTRVTVTPGQATLPAGSSLQLAAAAFDESGNPVSSVSYSWTSSNPAIADVTSTGRVLALSPGGPVTITARAGEAAGTSAITVSPAAAAPTHLTITVQPSSLAVRNLAFPQQPVIQLRDAAGNAVSQSGVPVTASIQSGPGSATLGGTTTVNTNGSGTASFTNLSLNRSGTFTLRFRSGNLQQAVSNSIVIP